MHAFAVILLNWNGSSDTLACLESLKSCDILAVPVIVDNGSSTESQAILSQGLMEQGWIVHQHSSKKLTLGPCIEAGHVWLVLADENLGFARGCNLGLVVANQLGFSDTVFLNNDTIVEKEALGKIVQFLRETPSLFAVIPQIRIFGTALIWNCGGELSRLGFRRYFFCEHLYSQTVLPATLDCTFFTGCCFAVRTTEFLARNGFCERFFFGEEDFELCFWMLDHHKRAACLTSSIIQHKVSASVTRAAGGRQSSKVYVHYLNRLTHLRLRWGAFVWSCWLTIYLPYVALLLFRSRILSPNDFFRFFTALLKEASTASGVDRQRFESIMKTQPW